MNLSFTLQRFSHSLRKKMKGGPVAAAYDHSSDNRKEIESSEIAGCFYCCETFEPKLVENWLNEGSGTAFCPRCGIDSVIGDASGFPAHDKKFLNTTKITG